MQVGMGKAAELVQQRLPAFTSELPISKGMSTGHVAGTMCASW